MLNANIVTFRLYALVAIFFSTINPLEAKQYFEHHPWLEPALEQTVDVDFKEADLAIVRDFLFKSGVQVVAHPTSYTLGQYTIKSDQVKLSDLLDQLKETGPLRIEFLDDKAVFWNPIDDEDLQRIKKIFDEPDADQLAAAKELIEYNEPRIYPVLFKALTTSDLETVQLIAKELSGHGQLIRHASNFDDFPAACIRVLEEVPDLTVRQSFAIHIYQAPDSAQAVFVRRAKKEIAEYYFVSPNLIGWDFAKLKAEYKDAPPVPPQTGGCPVGNPPPPVNRGQIIDAIAKLNHDAARRFLTQLAKLSIKDGPASGNYRDMVSIAVGLIACDADYSYEYAKLVLSISSPQIDPQSVFGPMQPILGELVDAMAFANDEKYLELIASLLKDERNSIRAKAIAYLGRSRHPEMAKPLLDLWPGTSTEKFGLLNALAKIKSAETLDFFRKRLDSETDREFAIYFLATVEELPSPHVIKELSKSSNSELVNEHSQLTWGHEFRQHSLVHLALSGDAETLTQLGNRRMQLVKNVEFEGVPPAVAGAERADQYFLILPESVQFAIQAMKRDNPREKRLLGARSLISANINGHYEPRRKLIDEKALVEIRKSLKDPVREIRMIARWIVNYCEYE